MSESSHSSIPKSTDALRLWRADRDAARPILVSCPDGEYPASDADGVKIYENSHFEELEDAWQSLENNAAAGVELVGGTIEGIRNQLRIAERRAADRAVFFSRVRLNRSTDVIRDGDWLDERVYDHVLQTPGINRNDVAGYVKGLGAAHDGKLFTDADADESIQAMLNDGRLGLVGGDGEGLEVDATGCEDPGPDAMELQRQTGERNR
jgi:hypothetical protein